MVFVDVPEALVALTRLYRQHETGMQVAVLLKTLKHAFYRRMDVSMQTLFTAPIFLIAECLCFYYQKPVISVWVFDRK
jgi:hypothetical protein